MPKYDWIIQGGRVIDPANNIDTLADIALAAGRIAAVQPNLEPNLAAQTYDARNKLITPGLVDLHVHAYNHVVPLGVDMDYYSLGRGVTTAVDTGSAGSDTFPGFRAYAAELAKTRLLAFVNISRAGICVGGASDGSNPGELDSAKFISADHCNACIEANRDLVIGVKVRLSATIADDGRNEDYAYQSALDTASAAQLPLMVHHSFSTVPLEESPGRMAPGDIYTHAFHGWESTIIDPQTRQLHPSVLAARQNGVLFDIGHGMGGFNWTVGEICAAADFWPHTISTDMHSLTCEGPGYDLPTVMSRLLHLGMPLNEVVRASTITPAQAINWHDRIGTLNPGREADVAVLSLDPVDMLLEDCQAQMRRIRQRLVPCAVWRAGQAAAITTPLHFPNQEKIEAAKAAWPNSVIRDDSL